MQVLDYMKALVEEAYDDRSAMAGSKFRVVLPDVDGPAGVVYVYNHDRQRADCSVILVSSLARVVELHVGMHGPPNAEGQPPAARWRFSLLKAWANDDQPLRSMLLDPKVFEVHNRQIWEKQRMQLILAMGELGV